MSTGSLDPPILDPAPDWIDASAAEDPSQFLILWHGCTNQDYEAIKSSGGIDPQIGLRFRADFGLGYYTTTWERQARQWAHKRFYDMPLSTPAPLYPVTLRFRVPLSDLAPLDALHFVTVEYDDISYWSFVQHCRQSPVPPASPRDHGYRRKIPLKIPPPKFRGDWYDIVSGPVSDFWRQRSAMRTADQVSFHTPRAASVLDTLWKTAAATASGSSPEFRVDIVL